MLYYFFTKILILHQSLWALELSFDDKVLVKKTDQTIFNEHKSDQPLVLENDSAYFILGPKNIPLLVITSTQKSSQIKISNNQLSQIFDEKTNDLINLKINELVTGMRKAESLLVKKEFNTALNTINALKEKHKNVASLLFLSATTHTLMNNKKLAREDIEAGLKIDPENSNAQNMLKNLKGEKP